MILHQSENILKLKIEEIFLTLHKKMFMSLIIMVIIMLISDEIRILLNKDYHSSYLRIQFPIYLFLSILSIFLIKKITSTKCINIIYVLLIIICDAVLPFGILVVPSHLELLYTRLFYMFICFLVMFINIKMDLSICQFVSFIICKIIIFVVILYIHRSDKYLIFDIYMIFFAIAISIINVILKRTLLNSIEKLNRKNVALMNKFTNIVNTMKNPLVSFNFKKNIVYFNAAFINFIKQNFGVSNEIKYLFNELSESDSKGLFENELKYIGVEYFDKIENTLRISKNVKKLENLEILKKKIFIMGRIFSSFHVETHSNVDIIDYFDIYELIKNKRIFEENEHFDHKGTYKITNSEKIIEINWRKTIYSEKEEVLDVMFHDLTVLREIQYSKADMKYRQIYLAKVAHEFKTPINVLIYSLKELINKFEIDNKAHNSNEILKSFAFIEGQANFISILIHDINDYCKDLKDFEICLDTVDVKNITEFVFQILNTLVNKDQNKRENVKIELNINQNVPILITTDERRLKQLLVNLISNAVKFTNFGHIKLNVEYDSNIEDQFGHVKFSVEDTGIGINKEDHKKLFEEYVELNKDYFKLNKEGTGLGLSICKKIIKKLGKDLTCESENNVTKFSFKIFDFKPDDNIILNEIINEETINNNTFTNEDQTKLLQNKNYYLDDEIKIMIRKKSQEIDIPIKSDSRIDLLKLNLENYTTIKLKSSEIIKINNNNNEIVNKYEKLLYKLLDTTEFSAHKTNFFNFNKPILKYMDYLLSSINKDVKYFLIIDDEKINVRALKTILKKFLNEKKLQNIKIIVLTDGIEALNLLYYDILFFMKISLIICDLNMKFMNGDLLFKVMNQVNSNVFQRINFVMYTNTDINSVYNNNGIKLFLSKPCRRIDVEKLFDLIGEI